MDEKGLSRDRILAELNEAFINDHHFRDGRILASMCTAPNELAIEAHMKFIETNLGNPDLYPGTKHLEKEVIKTLGTLLHAQAVSGHITNGGTESNITALWIAKKLSGKREVLFPKNVHFSIIKALDLLEMKPVEVDLDENYCMSLEDVGAKLSDNTAAVVCMAGATELGTIDPIEGISELSTGRAYLHVDAAFGGFVIPFLAELGYPMPKFDFEVQGVSSLTIDPHKMGLSTIPAGALLYRREEFLERITVDAPYLISMKHSTLSGTRNSAAVAATYAVLRYLGRVGFRSVVAECMETTKYCAARVRELGLELVIEPVMNVLALKLSHPEKVVAELARQNWFVSKGQFPKCLRLVIMPHVSRKVIDEFIPVLERTCSALGEL
ncbi:tyrosine decarboxylase MfnA [[Eubacterium] cellulosolvens]